jgi:ribokinase
LHKGANFHITPAQQTPNLDGYTHLLIQNEIPLHDTLAYIRKAAKEGITTLFNPSPMLTPDELRAFPWSSLNWLIVNEGEIQDLLRAFGAESTSSDAGVLVKELYAAEGFDKGVKVVCTLGAEGVMWATDGEGADVGKLPAGKLEKGVRDTTGAGDCFLGYLTAGLMRGETLEVALQNCLAVSHALSTGQSEKLKLRHARHALRTKVRWIVCLL